MKGLSWSSIQILSDSNINIYNDNTSTSEDLVVFVTVRGTYGLSDVSSILDGITYIVEYVHKYNGDITIPLFLRFFVREPMTRQEYAFIKGKLTLKRIDILSLKNEKNTVTAQIRTLKH